jgi:superfamily I DNA and/or RNA helicase
MFHHDKTMNILLLAYTNRAVDEICKSLSSIEPSVDYLRVGSELSCDPLYRSLLLENVLNECKNRKEVTEVMSHCRIYVGTVATISSKSELFKIKHFDVAIIDEATQILEPQLLGILCAKVPDGRNAVGKFILIGDHKQLPAVVLQESAHSEVHSEELRQIGIQNLKDSLFERLYRYHLQRSDSPAIDMLCKQGRMHPDVAKFANEAFYQGKLEPVGLPHQLETLDTPVSFIPSLPDYASSSGKANHHEVTLVAECASRIWTEYGASFDATCTLGIITPYRNQIALIRKELSQLNIPALMDVSVDTVERYQGSERDVIIYSFCVNTLSQLRTLPNLTEENGVLIDRKLNVVLTRARKKLIIIGNPELLRHDSIYANLLDSMNV